MRLQNIDCEKLFFVSYLRFETMLRLQAKIQSIDFEKNSFWLSVGFYFINKVLNKIIILILISIY